MSKTNKCRFCFTKQCYKKLSDDHFYCGTIENYKVIIMETYNLSLKHDKGFICEDCIRKLREASAFKKQVLEAEQRLVVVKEEMQDSDEDVGLHSERVYVEIENGQIKKEHDTQIHDNSIKCEKVSLEDGSWDSGDGYTLSESDSIQHVKNNKKGDRTKTKPSLLHEQLRENTYKLLINSNICLFKSLKTKFACAYCKETYFNMADLREHSTTHTTDNKKLRTKINRLKGFSFKTADITDLKCKLCLENCQNIELLQTHLTEKHGVLFEGSSNFLIPFNLGNGLNCVICNEKFLTFTRLLVHMNIHSTSNVCEICGVSFYTRISLRNHINTMHREHKCKLCNSTFNTAASKIKHLNKIHNINTKRRLCLKCDSTFKYTHQLFEHMIETHGLKRPDFTCQYCGKKFKTRNLLGIHTRNVHLKERKFNCSLCDMRFFTSCDKRRHEKSHENNKSVKCMYCDVMLKTEEYLRKHVKRFHAGEDKKSN